MVKRYFSLFNLKMLVGVLALFYLLVLTSDNINGILENIGGMVFMTMVALLWNVYALENWKWIYTGEYTDLTNSALSKNGIKVKEARLGKTNPLFVVGDKRYFYYDDNYGMIKNKEKVNDNN